MPDYDSNPIAEEPDGIEPSYNNAMRYGLAQIALLACLLTGGAGVYAQAPDTAETRPPCSGSDDKRSVGRKISIAEVTFSGSLEMPITDQDQIAASVKRQTSGNSLEIVTDEALERVRAGWQNRGYFKVQVSGDTETSTSNPVNQRFALNVHVDEGPQYSLGAITFKHNKVIGNVEFLRGLFPIKDGDVFNREKIAKGLEYLSKAYGELGYINFTSIPNTSFDEDKRLVFLDIDVDEGTQFYVDSINILGLEESDREELLKSFPIKSGQLYNQALYESFLLKNPSMFSDCGCGSERKLDERTGTITLTFDFRPCPVE